MILFVSGVTYAFLSASDTAINTVTIGKVAIDVVERLWNESPDSDGDGIPDAAENIMPNQIITKDPNIKNIGNNDAWVYLSVQIPTKEISSYEADGTPVNSGNPTLTELFSYEINDEWILVDENADDESVTYVYGYKTILNAGEETTTLFDAVKVVNAKEGENLEETVQNIVINGYAIQSDFSGTLQNAWSVYMNQNGLTVEENVGGGSISVTAKDSEGNSIDMTATNITGEQKDDLLKKLDL